MNENSRPLWRRVMPLGIIGIPLIFVPVMVGTPAFADESAAHVTEATPSDAQGLRELPETTASSEPAMGDTTESASESYQAPSRDSSEEAPAREASSEISVPGNTSRDGEPDDAGIGENLEEGTSEAAPTPNDDENKGTDDETGSDVTSAGKDTTSSEEQGTKQLAPSSEQVEATAENPTDGSSATAGDANTSADNSTEDAPSERVSATSVDTVSDTEPSPADASKTDAGADTSPSDATSAQSVPAEETVKAGAVVDVPEGTYVIRLAVGNGMVIDVKDGKRTTVSSNIQTKKANGSASQLWDIIKSPQAGWYYIVAHGTNGALVIDVQGGKAANKTNLRLWEKNGTAAQLWQFIAEKTCLKGDLTNLVIVSKVGSQYVLDVYQGKAVNGTNIELYKKNGTKAQTVTLVRQTKYDPKKAATKGVWIYKPSGKTTMTYWYDASGRKAKNRVISPTEGANGYYFATSNGAIAKGTATKVGNTIYLSASNGKLATLSGNSKNGWLDSNAFGNGKRRYYLYRHGNDGYATAKYGYSTDGYPHYTCAKGHVLTGKWVDGGRIYLASSTGRMVSLASGAQRGWVGANFVSGQGRRKYYLYRTTENGRYKGACYAKAGFSRDGGFHYTRPEGYVLQNATMNTWAGRCSANKAGIITTNFNTVKHVWSILEHVSRNRKKYGETARAYTINGKKEYEYDVDDVNVGIFKIRKSTIDKAQNDLLGCSQYVQVIHGIWAHGARSNDIVTKFDITYGSSRAATEKFQKNVENATKGAIKKAKSIKSASKRATYLHDWLCANARYDYSYKIYDAYGIFTKKKGVCAAYAEAYVYLCRQSGLSCEYLVGKDHAWNRVKIGNKWLYTDVTWDDCGYGHYYHLRSKAWFESHDHHQL